MRRILLSFVLALSAVYASPALAQRRQRAGKGAAGRALKAPIIRAAFGSATWKKATATGKVALIQMPPNTTYEIAVLESPEVTGPWTPIVAGTITTNNVGYGNLAIHVERIPGTAALTVAAVPQGPGRNYGTYFQAVFGATSSPAGELE